MDYTDWDTDMLQMKKDDYYTIRSKHKRMIAQVDLELDEVDAEIRKRNK